MKNRGNIVENWIKRVRNEMSKYVQWYNLIGDIRKKRENLIEDINVDGEERIKW